MHIITVAAFAADMIIGDPEYRLHPARLIGKCIQLLEQPYRGIVKSERVSGALFAVTVISLSAAVTVGILLLAGALDGFFHIHMIKRLISIYFIYSCISVKDMKEKAMHVYAALKDGNMNSARERLSMIVGRDTKELNKEEIIRGTVESISESIVDGILSPLFFAFIAGPLGAVVYRAVNTLDSMVAYKNEKYIKFGMASARIDDVCNYIPARLSVLFIACAFFIRLKNGVQAVRIALRDGGKSPSPNSGIPEAAVAGGLGVRLGGVNYYFGKRTEKPFIGDKVHELDPGAIRESIWIEYITGLLFVIAGALCHYLLI
ncbi:adenosylcobinamide-phosphate synthase CbiB [Spirochaetota bacterium]